MMTNDCWLMTDQNQQALEDVIRWRDIGVDIYIMDTDPRSARPLNYLSLTIDFPK